MIARCLRNKLASQVDSLSQFLDAIPPDELQSRIKVASKDVLQEHQPQDVPAETDRIKYYWHRSKKVTELEQLLLKKKTIDPEVKVRDS
jgi:hypothetical protein